MRAQQGEQKLLLGALQIRAQSSVQLSLSNLSATVVLKTLVSSSREPLSRLPTRARWADISSLSNTKFSNIFCQDGGNTDVFTLKQCFNKQQHKIISV